MESVFGKSAQPKNEPEKKSEPAKTRTAEESFDIAQQQIESAAAAKKNPAIPPLNPETMLDKAQKQVDEKYDFLSTLDIDRAELGKAVTEKAQRESKSHKNKMSSYVDTGIDTLITNAEAARSASSKKEDEELQNERQRMLEEKEGIPVTSDMIIDEYVPVTPDMIQEVPQDELAERKLKEDAFAERQAQDALAREQLKREQEAVKAKAKKILEADEQKFPDRGNLTPEEIRMHIAKRGARTMVEKQDEMTPEEFRMDMAMKRAGMTAEIRSRAIDYLRTEAARPDVNMMTPKEIAVWKDEQLRRSVDMIEDQGGSIEAARQTKNGAKKDKNKPANDDIAKNDMGNAG